MRLLISCLLLSSVALATPPQVVRTDERLLGENDDAFAVIRRESDNLGSYYARRTRVSLEERSKSTGQTLKAVLLADYTDATDAEHEDPATPPKVTTTVAVQDETVKLGELLVRYALVAEAPTRSELRDRIRIEEDQKILFDGHLTMIQGSIANGVFREELARIPVALEEIRDAGKSIYLKLSKEEEEGDSQTCWVCVPPLVTAQVRAHESREEIYLSAGSFSTREEALQKAGEWKAKKVGEFDPEVWSTAGSGNQRAYHVVLRGSMDLIRRQKFEEIGSALGLVLKPVSSKSFREWTPVR